MSKPRIKEQYEKEILPAIMKEFGIKNRMAAPNIKKISVNVGIGRLVAKDAKMAEGIADNVAKITGQKPVITKSKKSIAAFKLREGMPVGVMVTLRGPKMYEFLDRLVNVAIPRIRDFRGLNDKAFDDQGNYSIGIKEHSVFPEIILESTEAVHGMQVNINLNTKNKELGMALLKKFGFPFKEAVK